MWERKSFVELWDVIVFAMSMPVVLLMGLSLPADWDHHTGHSQPGIATVTSVEPTRGGSHITVDVRSASGELLANGHEVDGDAPHRLGATFDISYANPDGIGTTQVYTAGHDPFRTNAIIFAVALSVWLAATASLAARTRRLAGRTRTRRRGPSHYSAGRGYVVD
jgi:hypothetical protein